jgi:hypothetical protein
VKGWKLEISNWQLDDTHLPCSPASLLPCLPAFLFRAHPGLIIAILVYLLAAFSYFFIVPIFEAPDEWTHAGHVKHIAEGNGLPVMLPGQGIWGGQQPPLYYSLGALLIQPFDLADFEDYLEQNQNPHASIGYALDPGNKNNYLHSPAENFPYRGLSLTVHVLRLYSILFGVVAVVFTYLTAFELASGFEFRVQSSEFRVQSSEFRVQSSKLQPPHTKYYALRITHHTPLFAAVVALLVATQPMFAFITASVHNEPANIALSAIGLWLAQRYVIYGPSRSWGRALTLGVVIGLISLSKMTGLAFGLAAVVALLQSAIATPKQPGAARWLWRDGVIIGLAFLAVGGWWYWRNYQLYGDFFQRGLYKIYFNQTPQPLSLSDFLFHLRTAEVSFWATFGWLNLIAPEWVYSLYRIISRMGLLGLVVAVIIKIGWLIKQRMNAWPQSLANNTPHTSRTTHHALQITHYALRAIYQLPFTYYQSLISNLQSPSPLSLLLIHLTFPIAVAFSLTRLVALEGGLQGRQLLPALGSIAIIIIWGWWTLAPGRIRRPVLGLLAAILFGLALWLPYAVVAREYIPRPLLAETDLPAGLTRLDWTYNDEIKVIGVELGAEVVKPGQRVPVTLYWQALKPMTTNYSVFIHLIGRDYQNVGQLNTYPGLGLRPTTSLEPGQIVADIYPVQVGGGSQAPTRLLVNAGLFDFNEPGRPGIQPTAAKGNFTSPTVGRLKLIPTEWPAASTTTPVATFGDNIQLADYHIEGCESITEPCQVIFIWQAQGHPATDYTVFVQLWRSGQKIIGFDSPPLASDYPTSLWAAAEVIVDPHPLDISDLAPGEYRILAGLYNFAIGERLPANAADGSPLPGYALDLGVISIKP